jgi:hypothetical protein
MDIATDHGHGYAAWTRICSLDTDMQNGHGHGHAALTWTHSMDTDMPHGHGYAASTWIPVKSGNFVTGG